MQSETFLEITSNGSGSVQPIEALFARLESEPLDNRFEDYGNFFYAAASPSKGFGKPSAGYKGYIPKPREVRFFGNFLRTSHVFNIATNDKALIQRLAKAIRANQKRPDYLAQ